jgi:serine/threonine protein phosphatase PrpC
VSREVWSIHLENIQSLILCSDGFWSESERLLNTDVSNVMKLIQEEIERLELQSKDNFSVVIV